jgi:hypothetical protein
MVPWFIYLLLPFAIATLGLRLARSFEAGRWLVHIACMSALIVGGPLAYIWLTTPSDIVIGDAASPGAGLAFLAFLAAVIFAAILYVRGARNLRAVEPIAS